MVNILNEMSVSRADAMNLCISLGKNFINHYLKVRYDIKNNDGDLNHHISEMQNWWDTVRKLKLKQNNKNLTNVNLIDWFFTSGSSVEDLLDEEYVDDYNKFILSVLLDRDKELSEVISELYL